MKITARGRCEEKGNKGEEKISSRVTRIMLKRSSLIGIIFFVLYKRQSDYMGLSAV